ncbi:MAG: hypothetical protein ACK4TR_02095 [Phenylobacterium sp.]|uniref:hypothetical protein n=1 Tax=Phenylobacterium sp. TaxID=1871053 RepID=UPI00391A71C0
MRWIMLAAGCLWATGALAQPLEGEPPPPEPDGPPGGGRLFISPAGEPFRQGDGRAAWFAGADRDGDTLLTEAEFRLDAERFFAVLDADGNGTIDGFENQAYERDVVPEITRLAGPFGGGPAGRRPEGGRRGPPPGGGDGGLRGLLGKGPQAGGERRDGAARWSLLNIPQPVRGADADLSGRVSLEEWRAAASRRFSLLDADGDGVLTLDTLPNPPGGPPRPRD